MLKLNATPAEGMLHLKPNNSGIVIPHNTCPILQRDRLAIFNQHRKMSKLPYAVAIAQVNPKLQVYHDAQALNESMSKSKKFAFPPTAKQTFQKVDYLMTSDNITFTHLIECTGTLSDKAKLFVMACKSEKSNENAKAKQALVKELLVKKEWIQAYNFLEYALEEFPNDIYINQTLGEMLCNGDGCDKDEKRGKQLKRKATYLKVTQYLPLPRNLAVMAGTYMLPEPFSYVFLGGVTVLKLLPQKMRIFKKETHSDIFRGMRDGFFFKLFDQFFLNDGFAALQNPFFYGNTVAQLGSWYLSRK